MLNNLLWVVLSPILSCCLLFIIPNSVYGQDSAQWVINNYLEKTGGIQIWEKTKAVQRRGISSRFNGGYTGTSAEGETTFYLDVINRDGDTNKSHKNMGNGRSDSTFFCYESGRVSMLIVYKDGTSRFEQIPGEGHYYYKAFDPQLVFFDVEPTLWTYAGRTSETDHDYYVLNYKTPGENGSQYFFDTETGFLMKSEVQEPHSVVEYEEYTAVEGRLIPLVMKHYRLGRLVSQRRHTQVEYGARVLPCHEFMPDHEADGQ